MNIGTCGLCGGAVTVPDAWCGTIPPIPRCSSCGAQPKAAHGPVIEMEPRKFYGGPGEYVRVDKVIRGVE